MVRIAPLFFLFVSALCGCGKQEKAPLVVFCASGLQKPVSSLAAIFEKETGVPVRLQFGGSGTLLSSLRVASADIFLAADASYIEEAKKLELVADVFPLAEMKAGLGVIKGNPKQVKELRDLGKEGLRVGIGNPGAASIGRFTRQIMTKHGLWEGFRPSVEFPTVNELANAIKLDAVDAVVIWDVVARQYPEIEFISLPEFSSEPQQVAAAVTRSSVNREAAIAFCRFLASKDPGFAVFQKEGYAPVSHGGTNQ